MGTKRSPARDVAKTLPGGNIWIDHAFIAESDLDWLASVERLTLWNVTIPPGFLTKLNRLWWLDLRGGSASDVSLVRETPSLRFLDLNQIRGLHDLSAITSLRNLEYLRIYGLPKVLQVPSLASLKQLERVEIGQLRGLTSLDGILDAPGLKELVLIRKIHVSDSDVERINGHSSLTHFDWFAEDVPDRVWLPVKQRIKLPEARTLYPEEWFNN